MAIAQGVRAAIAQGPGGHLVALDQGVVLDQPAGVGIFFEQVAKPTLAFLQSLVESACLPEESNGDQQDNGNGRKRPVQPGDIDPWIRCIEKILQVEVGRKLSLTGVDLFHVIPADRAHIAWFDDVGMGQVVDDLGLVQQALTALVLAVVAFKDEGGNLVLVFQRITQAA